MDLKVDSGRMRGLDVDASSAVRHLSERWVSQAAAQQRAGRAGRTGPGRCVRLFSERRCGGGWVVGWWWKGVFFFFLVVIVKDVKVIIRI